MELPSEPSSGDALDTERTLYRAGSTPPATLPPPRRGRTWKKRILRALCAILFLLLLGGVSYWLFLPNLEDLARQRRAILDDANLTWDQKIEKIRDMDSKLTPEQSKQLSQIDFRRATHARNAEMHRFLQMSPEEQAAYIKREGQGKPIRLAGAVAGGGPVTAGGGGKGQHIFVGPAGSKPDFGNPFSNPGLFEKTKLDDFSPETRAGGSYRGGLSR